MTLHDHIYPSAEAYSPAACNWEGGAARLYTRRLFPNFRLSKDEAALLTPLEQTRLKSNLKRDKIHRSLAARGQLRVMLGEILESRPHDVRLTTSADGRPELHPQYGIKPDVLDFSVSYIPEGFAIGISKGHRIGVDIQGFKQRQHVSFDRLFGSRFTRKEVTSLEAHEIWTRMEAYGKMQGQGLGYGMHRLYGIALTPGIAAIECHFLDFRFGPGIALSICMSGRSSGPVCLLNN